jgi:uncharacterized protein (TIGR03000 family)
MYGAILATMLTTTTAAAPDCCWWGGCYAYPGWYGGWGYYPYYAYYPRYYPYYAYYPYYYPYYYYYYPWYGCPVTYAPAVVRPPQPQPGPGVNERPTEAQLRQALEAMEAQRNQLMRQQEQLRKQLDELRKRLEGKPKEDEVAAPAPARVVVTLPDDARLFVDDDPCTLTSSKRAFDTPELQPGMPYHYTLRVEVTRNGRTVKESKRVTVRAGQETVVEFGEMRPVEAASR